MICDARDARIKRRDWWIVLVILVMGLALRAAVSPSYGYLGIEADLIEQKQAMHRSITLGFHELYTPNDVNDPALAGGEWTGGYFINYPPIITYLRYLPGLVYRALEPESFELWNSENNFYVMRSTDLMSRLANSRGFTVAVKFPGILFDCILAAGIFLFLAPRAGSVTALAATAAYSFNPGLILNSAHWGQPDAVWALPLVLCVLLMNRGRVEFAWIAYTFAALTKPQAGAYVFFVLFLGLSRAPIRRGIKGAALSIGFACLVFLPFLLYGTFIETIEAILYSVLGGEPFVSCNANNFWWLLTGGRGYEVSDLTPILGPLSPRNLGLMAVLGVNGIVMWKLRKPGENAGVLFLAASLVGMTFFCFNTELHENHVMAIIPLSFLAISADRRCWVPAVITSITLMMNIVLFDPALHIPVSRAIGFALPIQSLSIGVSALNLIAWGMLAALFWLHTRNDHVACEADLQQS